MDTLQASRELWAALIATDQYIARGLQEQVSSSKSFSGDDMKPVLAAHRVFKETEPFLPADLVEATDALFVVAQDELNNYLKVLQRAILAPTEEHKSAVE